MSIRPIGKRVLVTEKKVEEKRASGLIIPGNSDDRKIRYGRVAAVGTSVEEVSAGETVIFGSRSGRDIEDRGEKYILLELDEVMAVIEGEK